MMELSRETVAGVIGAVIAVLLQITVAPAITLFEAVPNFIVAFCIVRAVATPASSGSVMPLVLGLLFDLMGGGPVGGMAFVLVLVTFLASRLFMALNNDTLFMPVAIMLACIMLVEVMGNKAGWLTLYAGIAGGADIILIPELPYTIDNVCAAIERRAAQGKHFSILAVAEGAYDAEEARMKKKERLAKRAEKGYTTATNRIARQIEEMTGIETRVCVPGHMQRGGSPSAYDRVLATQFGSYAAKMVEDENYGVTVAMKNNHVGENKLKDVAGKSRLVPESHGMLEVARRMGISMG